MTTTDFEPAVPAAVLAQDVPVGGVDSAGRVPPAAVPTVTSGITLVRSVPPMTATSGLYPFSANTSRRLIGEQPQRRRLLVSADVEVRLCSDQQAAESGGGLIVPADTIVPLYTAHEVWFYATDAGSISYWAELDQG